MIICNCAKGSCRSCPSHKSCRSCPISYPISHLKSHTCPVHPICHAGPAHLLSYAGHIVDLFPEDLTDWKGLRSCSEYTWLGNFDPSILFFRESRRWLKSVSFPHKTSSRQGHFPSLRTARVVLLFIKTVARLPAIIQSRKSLKQRQYWQRTHNIWRHSTVMILWYDWSRHCNAGLSLVGHYGVQQHSSVFFVRVTIVRVNNCPGAFLSGVTIIRGELKFLVWPSVTITVPKLKQLHKN